MAPSSLGQDNLPVPRLVSGYTGIRVLGAVAVLGWWPVACFSRGYSTVHLAVASNMQIFLPWLNCNDWSTISTDMILNLVIFQEYFYLCVLTIFLRYGMIKEIGLRGKKVKGSVSYKHNEHQSALGCQEENTRDDPGFTSIPNFFPELESSRMLKCGHELLNPFSIRIPWRLWSE